MGYTTIFKGELKFTTEVTNKVLAKIKSFFGEDCREHPEWNTEGSYIDLKFNNDLTGIKWDDTTENNRGMVSHINLIIDEAKKIFPEFCLEGQLLAQGDDTRDKWAIIIENNKAIYLSERNTIICPYCHNSIII